MARPRLVVFDLDGTLIDSAQDLATALNETLLGVSPATRPLPLGQVRSFVGEGARRLVARGLEAAGVDVDRDEAVRLFMENYSAHLLDTTRFYPGIEALLEALADRRLAVLTNKPGAFSRKILAGLGASHRFFRVVGGDESPRKPDPGGLLSLAEEAGVAVSETVLVGDSAIDVRTGRAAGVTVVGVTWGLAPASLDETPPDVWARRVEDLGAALGA